MNIKNIAMAALGLFFLSGVFIYTIASNSKTTKEPSTHSGSSSKKIADNSLKGNELYDAILKAYVNDPGFVDYRALKNDMDKLNNYVKWIGDVSETEYEAMSEKEKLAYWINSYNAFTLKVIVDNYPIKASGLSAWRFPKNSIRQIDGAWTKITFSAAGRSVTLDAIEHQILRKDFKEPRIHVAINCASWSCPPLRNEAYRADKLDAQLEDQSSRFIRNANNFRIDRMTNIVHLSSIFDWFGEDFISVYDPKGRYQGSEAEQAVLAFAVPFISASDGQYLEAARYKIKYLDYNWTLNEQ